MQSKQYPLDNRDLCFELEVHDQHVALQHRECRCVHCVDDVFGKGRRVDRLEQQSVPYSPSASNTRSRVVLYRGSSHHVVLALVSDRPGQPQEARDDGQQGQSDEEPGCRRRNISVKQLNLFLRHRPLREENVTTS